MLRVSNWIFFGVFGLLIGCANRQTASPSSPNPPTDAFHRLEGAGIENLFDLGGGIFSGSSPEGGEGFATLQKLGVKTIISVDGAPPDASLAARYGLRYIHLPIGYDGTTGSNALRIVKAAQVSPGAVYVHCHHGQHRGPAAAALICEALEGWSPQQGEAWLQAAGTATNYTGLYRMVREFHASERELRAVPKTFSSRAPTPKLVRTMVQLDDHFGALKAMQKAGFEALPEHPDATPESESLLLRELFREAQRARLGADRGEIFLHDLARAELAASDLQKCLKDLDSNRSPSGRGAAEASMQAMGKTCAACHKTHRD